MNDLTNEWPSDPHNDELVQLAEHLRNSPTALPGDAMSRIAQQMQAELDRSERRQRRRVALGWSMAAAILLAVSSYAILRMSADSGVAMQALVARTPIEDHVVIAVGDSTRSAADDQALVRLDEYRSLFAD